MFVVKWGQGMFDAKWGQGIIGIYLCYKVRTRHMCFVKWGQGI